jgi:hypothetical protein
MTDQPPGQAAADATPASAHVDVGLRLDPESILGDGSVRRAAMLTAGLGIVHALLVIASFVLLQPVPRSGDAAVALAFYAGPESGSITIASLYLMPFAGIAFIWFVVTLRMWISGTHRRANVLLSNVQLVCGIAYIILLFVAAGSLSATVMVMHGPGVTADPLFAILLPSFGDTIVAVFATRMAAMFVITTTSIARSADVLPRWFVWLSYGLGIVLLLSGSISRLLVLAFPAWLLVLSVLLLVRARRIPADLSLSTLGAPAGTILPVEED